MSRTNISFGSSLPPPLPIHRFTVEQYHRLGELGVIGPEDRVELLEGWIIEKMNQRPAHGFVVRILDSWLQSNISGDWIVQCQLPITLQNSEPEPDLAVIRGTHGDFRQRHPGGEECRLVIEVADTSLEKDQAKAAIYAAARVEEYWIVNLIDKNVAQMFRPTGGAYSETRTLTSADSIELHIDQTTLTLTLSQLFDEC